MPQVAWEFFDTNGCPVAESMLDDASQHAESLSTILPGILTTGTALSNKKLGLCCPVPFSTTLCDVLSGLPVVHGGN